MTSEVAICNMALAQIGSTYKINRLDEQSEEAENCQLYFDHVRDATLQDFPWSFARKRELLAKLDDEPPAGYEFRYQYPNDALRGLWLLQCGQAEPAQRDEWYIENQGNAKCVITSIPEAELTYTARVTDPMTFPPMFVDVLCWNLSASLAMPITKDMRIREQAVNMYRMALDKAWAQDMNEVQDREGLPRMSEFVTARLA